MLREVYCVKVRFFDRLLTAVAGLLLFATGLIFFLWAFRGIPANWVDALTVKEIGRLPIFVALGLGALMVLLGIHGISLLFRRRGKKGFVVQKTEHGELSISIHAMENLVQKCVDKHEELTIVSNRIENTRDGVVVDLRIGLANGVSIPLVVSTLQKQIKQYITSCSGIDVKGVKVEVETANIKAEKSPYSVPDSLLQNPPKAAPVEMPSATRSVQPLERPAQPVERVERAERAVTPPPNGAQPAVKSVQQPAPQVMQRMQPDLKGPSFPEPPAPAPAPPPAEHNEEKKRPLHQRLFGHKEQPAIVPIPPDLEVKSEVREEPILFDLAEEDDPNRDSLDAQEEDGREER